MRQSNIDHLRIKKRHAYLWPLRRMHVAYNFCSNLMNRYCFLFLLTNTVSHGDRDLRVFYGTNSIRFFISVWWLFKRKNAQKKWKEQLMMYLIMKYIYKLFFKVWGTTLSMFNFQLRNLISIIYFLFIWTQHFKIIEFSFILTRVSKCANPHHELSKIWANSTWLTFCFS